MLRLHAQLRPDTRRQSALSQGTRGRGQADISCIIRAVNERVRA